MKKLMPISRYIPLLSKWLWLGRWYVAILVLLVLTILWLAVLPAFSWLGDCKEREARCLGWLLQVIGFTVIAWGYNSDARQNERLSPFRWLSQFPRPFAGRIVSASGSGIIGLGSMSARGMAIRHVTSTSTVEERLTALEENTKAYFEEASAQWSDLRTIHSKLRSDFDEHSATTSTAISGLSERIVESVSGRVQLNLFAVALFLVGISVATLSPELASLSGQEASCSGPLF